MHKRASAGRAGALACGIVALAIAPVRLWAQDLPTTQQSASDAEWKRQMEARMQQLETENRDLHQEVGTIRQTQQAVMKDAQERGFLTLEGGQPRLTTPDFFDINKYAAEGN